MCYICHVETLNYQKIKILQKQKIVVQLFCIGPVVYVNVSGGRITYVSWAQPFLVSNH